jgi:hypothetical protein
LRQTLNQKTLLTMKKLIFAMIAGVALCAAGLTGDNAYAVVSNPPGNLEESLRFNKMGDDDIDGGTIGTVTVECSGNGSGKCYQLWLMYDKRSGSCFTQCLISGSPQDSCSAHCAAFLSLCIAVSDLCAPVGFSDLF